MLAVACSCSAPRVRCCDETLGNPTGTRSFQLAHPSLTHMPPAALGPIPRPRRIILVRHGQSEGNVDESAYTRIPDPKIGLTPTGWAQAEACGSQIRDLVAGDPGGDDWKVYFYVSPYRRTLETLDGIGRAFERDRIAGVREEPRLREQDFGKNSSHQFLNLCTSSYCLMLSVFGVKLNSDSGNPLLNGFLMCN